VDLDYNQGGEEPIYLVQSLVISKVRLVLIKYVLDVIPIYVKSVPKGVLDKIQQ
jgi:hypothetical protein